VGACNRKGEKGNSGCAISLGLKDSVGGWQNSLEILATFIAGVCNKSIGSIRKNIRSSDTSMA
jgi:hypothetical protein